MSIIVLHEIRHEFQLFGNLVTVHGHAGGTDPVLRTSGASETNRIHGRWLFFAVKMRQSPTRERLRNLREMR
jgi:hypothetical protein